jgi:hypothetical protein
MSKIKQLWKGMFNFRRELYIEFAYAYTVDQAKIVMARRIAKKQEVLPVIVLGYLKDHPNSFEIKLEIEFKEVENG